MTVNNGLKVGSRDRRLADAGPQHLHFIAPPFCAAFLSLFYPFDADIFDTPRQRWSPLPMFTKHSAGILHGDMNALEPIVWTGKILATIVALGQSGAQLSL